ncbi:O-antigen ligase family protein [Aequorivita sinensis]|uniref:O-antigen ligase family protein n=1 Tax=Aequorivita sinensis TaxID=1382458 RepID=UPI00111FE78B|nr:O-antigen ligase family protein [Aequorivita sinensis]
MKRFILSKQELITFILVLIVCVTLPVKNNINSLSMILLGAFAAIVLIFKKQFDFKILRRFIPLILFYIVCLISVFYSENQDLALKMIGRLVPFLTLPIIFSILPPLKKERYPSLMKFFIGSMVIVCMFSHTLVLIKLLNNNDSLYNIFNSHYSYLSLSEDTIGMHSTYYAYLIILAVMFVVHFLFSERRWKYRILYFLLLGYFTFFVFHLSARLPIAVLFLFYNIALVYYFVKQKKVLKGVLFLLLLYIITSLVIYNVRITRYRFQQLVGFTYSDGTHYDDGKDKIFQWKAGASANKNVLFGNGIGDANQSIFDSYNNSGLHTYAERKYNAHNQYIQTFVGMGVIGLITLLFIFFYYLRLFYQQKHLIGFTFLLLTTILYLTESYLERHNGIVTLVFIICLFVTQSSIKENLLTSKENYIK